MRPTARPPILAATETMNCHLCGTETAQHFDTQVLGGHAARYAYCADCDHIFADSPDWLDEAYTETTDAADTDTATRNVLTALRLAALCHVGLGERGEGVYVDVAGGYGLLTRLMRDLGFNYFWSDRYTQNLFARGFEYQPGLGACRAVSAIEVLEHTVNPIEFIRQALAQHQSDTFIFTTETFPDGCPPRPGQWGYYALESGQHIAFFSPRGLTRLAERLGMHHFPLGRIHLFSKKPLPRWRLRLASNKLLIVPLALYALTRLGSRRASDQQYLERKNRPAPPHV